MMWLRPRVLYFCWQFDDTYKCVKLRASHFHRKLQLHTSIAKAPVKLMAAKSSVEMDLEECALTVK